MLRRNLYRGAAGLLALLVALYVARATMARLRALTEPVPVVVALTVIPPYTAIAPGMVEVVYLPRATVPQPVYTDPAEVVGRLARMELLPGVPLLRTYAVPAAELRYTADARSVILGVTVAAVRVPGDLILPGHRVDIWRADRLVGPDLRVVAISRLPEGKWVVALESPQELVPALLAASGQRDVALTLSPLERLASAQPHLGTPSATASPSPTVTPTLQPTAVATATPTPGVAVVKPGPAQGLNVRAGPGTDYPVLATLRAGSRLTLVGRNAEGQWVQVCCVAGDKPGWVLAELVDLAADLRSLPVR